MVIGWVSLITVAGVTFYFAKQNIVERRRQQDISGRERIARDEAPPQQALRKEHPLSPNPLHGSHISNSKCDAP
ncbi:hypothetical protein B0F90DRAFT_1718787 [Multifurca ochricompacta]|uniref:Uncharacterized protein n=1 Tax=Multifurca ochricompacta TaxID=376703 RepID=A0AAD4M572_9AGAM|nr:hypothetical protein B0F90DRAFT_1718787 [Multifurca ochricompacta]